VRRTAAFALVLALGCGGEEPAAPASSAPAAPAAAPSPAPAGKPIPAGNLRGDPAAGKVIYGQFCAVCHGAAGKGDGPTAATLFPKPADHTDPARMKELSDEQIYRTIDGGGAAVGKSPLMPPWGGALNPQDIKDVLAYVRSLSGT
jgi:mono/diheme cytochrome c family protein